MAYEYVNPIKQFNFQINRVLTYGDAACRRQEVTESLSSVRTFAQWNQAWLTLAEKAEREKRWLHAAYYYRMAEFFMKADNPSNIFIRASIRSFISHTRKMRFRLKEEC